MNSRTISLVAIALWVIVVAAFGYRFIVGSTAPASDGRTAILLAEAERDAILTEMRHMLETVQSITAALARNDVQGAAEAAHHSGAAAAADLDPALMTKLPLEFKQLGMNVHAEFDRMAGMAGPDVTSASLLDALATQLSSCVACHETYKLQIAP